MQIKSFSFKYSDIDKTSGFVIDARVIDDPAITVSKGMVVTDGDLRAEVMLSPIAHKLIKLGIEFLESNPSGTLLVGCAYGKHRSVAIADAIAEHFGIKAEHIASRGTNNAIVIP